MSDEYVTVSVILVRRTKKAICVATDETASTDVWIPRSCLHAGSDATINEAELESEITMSIARSLAVLAREAEIAGGAE
jgi:hypothetical protein